MHFAVMALIRRLGTMVGSSLVITASVAVTDGLAAPMDVHIAQQDPSGSAGFMYPQDHLPSSKPWTQKPFQNAPRNFQFVIIGDRTGGANAAGTFKRAIEQLNPLQPEFVINVGDTIEG
jgi:hypothetical protein